MFVNKWQSRSQGLPGASLLMDRGDPEQVWSPETREIQRILCWFMLLGTPLSLGAINFVAHLYILVRLHDRGNGACDKDKRSMKRINLEEMDNALEKEYPVKETCH